MRLVRALCVGALSAAFYGCPPCGPGRDPALLMSKHFEGPPECADDLCGFTVDNGTVRRAATFNAGEHGLSLGSSAVVSQAVSLELPMPADGGFETNGTRREYVQTIVHCDPNTHLEVEEVVSEIVLPTPPDAGVVRDAGSPRDAQPSDVAQAPDSTSADAGGSVDASADGGAGDDGGGSVDASADSGTSDAASVDASADGGAGGGGGSDGGLGVDASTDDVAEADASQPADASTPEDAGVVADSGPARDAGGISIPPPPRIRIGTAVLNPGTSEGWTRSYHTFTTQPATGRVVRATITNLRVTVVGPGACVIDNFEIGSSGNGSCAL